MCSSHGLDEADFGANAFSHTEYGLHVTVHATYTCKAACYMYSFFQIQLLCTVAVTPLLPYA